jgi:hypothetical protein
VYLNSHQLVFGPSRPVESIAQTLHRIGHAAGKKNVTEGIERLRG